MSSSKFGDGHYQDFVTKYPSLFEAWEACQDPIVLLELYAASTKVNRSILIEFNQGCIEWALPILAKEWPHDNRPQLAAQASDDCADAAKLASGAMACALAMPDMRLKWLAQACAEVAELMLSTRPGRLLNTTYDLLLSLNMASQEREKTAADQVALLKRLVDNPFQPLLSMAEVAKQFLASVDRQVKEFGHGTPDAYRQACVMVLHHWQDREAARGPQVRVVKDPVCGSTLGGRPLESPEAFLSGL